MQARSQLGSFHEAVEKVEMCFHGIVVVRA